MAKEILVVEDDYTFRKMVLKRLRNIEYDAEEAKDGVEALEKVHSMGDDLHLIILDIKMPRMNGIEFLKKMRDEGIDTPVVIIITQVDVSELEDCDVYAVLEKPIDWDTFRIKVVSALALARQRDEVLLKIRTLRTKLQETFNLQAAEL